MHLLLKLPRHRAAIALVCAVGILLHSAFLPVDAQCYETGMDSGAPSASDVDSGTQALLDWLARGEGDFFALTDNLIWPSGYELEAARPVTIDTAGFTITVPAKTALFISGPVRLTGGGPRPLVAVEAGGLLSPDQPVEILAAGDGAVAVLMKAGGVLAPNGCRIAASGTNATAIRAEGDLALETVNLAAQGAGSLCIDGAGAVELLFSSAAGEAQAIAAHGPITLDAAVVSPVPAGAQVIERTVSPFWNEANPILIPESDQFVFAEDRVDLLLEAPGYATRAVITNGSWAAGEQSFATPGLYSVAWELSSPAIEGLTDSGQAFPIPVRVVDTTRPYLIGANGGIDGISLRLFDELTEEPQGLAIRYSTDDGALWREWAQTEPIRIWGDSLHLTGTVAPDTTYLFEVELEQGTTARGAVSGRSNLLKVVTGHSGEIITSEVGGDRDDSDRDATTPPPDLPPAQDGKPPFGGGAPDGDSPSGGGTQGGSPARGDAAATLRAVPAQGVGETGAEPRLGTSETRAKPPAKTNEARAWRMAEGPAEAPTKAADAAAFPTAGAAEAQNAPRPQTGSPVPATDSPYIWVGLLAAAVAAVIGLWYWRRVGGQWLFVPLLCAILALSLTGFGLLNRYDNKYSAPGPGGANGILALDESAFAARPYLFLTSGWEFYGDALLSPQQLAEQARQPDRIVYIGQYGGFELGDPGGVPFGDATYRLTILTNAPAREYTLELPEIYSAYQLWVNGALKKSMGETGAEHYRPQTGNTSVTFEAGERIELVLAVSNYSSYYSGLVYPPALGTPDGVAQLLNLRFLAHAAAVAFALFLGTIYLVIGFFQRRRTLSIFFFLLCLCFAGYVGYPVVHTLGGGEAWYALEKLGLYGMLCAVSVLAATLCGIGGWVRRAAFAAGAAVCALILVFPILPFAWDPPAMYGYSFLLSAYKWGSCIYLLVICFVAARRERAYSRTLTAGICVFGASLLADRLFPHFEPIYTGWPAEWGGLALVCAIAGILCVDMVYIYRQKLQAEEHAAISAHALEIQLEHSRALTDYIDKNARRNHEAKKQISLLSFYYEQGELEKLGDYLTRLSETEAALRLPVYTSHALINAILSFQLSRAEAAGIAVEVNVVGLPAALGVSDHDLCALLINLLDNAIAACERLPAASARQLSVKMQVAGEYLSVICQNSMPADEDMRKPDWRTGHGYGLQIVEEIVKRYDGMQEIRREAGTFFIHTALRLPKQ